MKAFAYSSATTVDETVQQLGQVSSNGNQNGARALAGGTDLLTLMKAHIVEPSHLVDIKRLDEIPQGIDVTENGALIGALTTLADIELSETVQSRYPALAQAAALAATPQLRNMATIGGNLLQRPRCWYYRHEQFHCWLKGGDECHAREGQNQFHALFGDSPCVASHPSDLPAALVALDAEVLLRGPQGERTLAVEQFFTLPQDNHRRETVLEPDELVLSIRIPPQSQHSSSIYLKAMDRKVWAFALVGVAARLDVQGGMVTDARFVLNGVAPVPWRLHAVEQMLVGSRLDEAAITQIAEAAVAQAQPLQHNGYKIPLAQSLVRRSLQTLLQN